MANDAQQRTKKLEYGEAASLDALTGVAPEAIVSRTLCRSGGGSVTLFAFDTGQSVSEHTAPFEAMVHVLDGRFDITINGDPVPLGAGEVVLMPASIPHALHCTEAGRALVIMMPQEKE